MKGIIKFLNDNSLSGFAFELQKNVERIKNPSVNAILHEVYLVSAAVCNSDIPSYSAQSNVCECEFRIVRGEIWLEIKQKKPEFSENRRYYLIKSREKESPSGFYGKERISINELYGLIKGSTLEEHLDFIKKQVKEYKKPAVYKLAFYEEKHLMKVEDYQALCGGGRDRSEFITHLKGFSTVHIREPRYTKTYIIIEEDDNVANYLHTFK